MCVRFSKYVVALLMLVAVAAGACSDSDDTSPTMPTTVESAFVTAEPASAAPEFLRDQSCAHAPPFGVRISIIVRGSQDVIVRRLRFTFIDRLGGSAVPSAISSLASPPAFTATSPQLPLPVPGTVNIPGSSPIPIPGSSPINGVLVSGGGSRLFPFFVEFGCDLTAGGTLVASVDTSDRNGSAGTSEVRVRVGG